MPITRFRNKGLEELFHYGRTAKIKHAHHRRICEILDFLNAIGSISDCHGQCGFHALHGKREGEYSMEVSGNYRICFRWDGENAHHLIHEDYH